MESHLLGFIFTILSYPSLQTVVCENDVITPSHFHQLHHRAPFLKEDGQTI